MNEGPILLAISQPWAAEHALRAVARLARRLETCIMVLHVDRRSDPARMDGDRQAIRGFVERLASEQASCDLRFATGVEDVAGEILKVAEELSARLILVGIPGKTPFARMTNGDVTTQLMRRTTRPLLLLPPTTDVTF